MSNEMNTLFPGKEIQLNTVETIIIKPFTFGQLPKAIKIGQKIGGLLANMYQQGKFEDQSQTSANLMLILSEGGEDLINLMSLGINKPRDWFDQLQGDDGLNLTIAFLEVNIDFFTKKMMPQILEAMKKVQFKKEQA